MQSGGPGVPELVWSIGRRHYNLTTNRHQRLITD